MMKKWISLFDLCPVRPGTHKDRAARITAMSYLRNCQDKEQHMERRLLNTGEYILLRGKDSYSGLLQMVETNPVSRITGQAIVDLYNNRAGKRTIQIKQKRSWWFCFLIVANYKTTRIMSRMIASCTAQFVKPYFRY